ncbi:MAG: uroporphyrinogen decarboxylase family protein [bacterium]|nr:uroporphyrinogen decarboxylase family protein [bacterium]
MPAEMNPRERWGLLLIDELPDRPPVYPLVTSHAAAVFGCDLEEYCSSGKILARAQLQAQSVYKHEGLSVFTHVGILAEAMGSQYHLRKFEVPILDNPIITDLSQIGDLRLPDVQKAGRLPVYLEAIDYLYNAMGDVLPVFAFIPCSFTTAAGLRGTEDFLMDTIISPEDAHRLLEISLTAAIIFCDECILAGALPVLVDPLASGSVISRQTYLEFAFPYQKRLIDYLHRYDLDITLHICGKTMQMLDLIPETGADLFSFDQVDVQTTVKTMGDRVRLVGNLAPNILLASSKEPVDQVTDQIILHGLRNSKGFVLSTGCEVPIRCEPQKLEIVINRGKRAAYDRIW